MSQLSDHTYIREFYHHHTLKYDNRYHQEGHQSIVGTVHDQKWRPEKHQHTILVKTSLQNQAKSFIADKRRDKISDCRELYIRPVAVVDLKPNWKSDKETSYFAVNQQAYYFHVSKRFRILPKVERRLATEP